MDTQNANLQELKSHVLVFCSTLSFTGGHCAGGGTAWRKGQQRRTGQGVSRWIQGALVIFSY